MSTNGDDAPVTAADLRELRDALEDLRSSQQELRDASNANDKRSARRDVQDAREDLDELAQRLGISRATLDGSIAAAKNAERKDELRPIIVEILSELNDGAGDDDDPPADDDPADDDDPPADDDPAADDDPPAPKQRKPKPDTEPVKPHWAERGVGELLK